MKQEKWFNRDFNFNITQNVFPSVLERLAGTHARLEEKFKTIPLEIITNRLDSTWSIKENLGHLSDLEPIWQGRFEDISNGLTELRHADLSNSKTTSANHNDKPLNELLQMFRDIRNRTVLMLENIDEELVFRSALHPRLKTPMRTLDLFIFVAEHDDHHLARITELTRILRADKI